MSKWGFTSKMAKLWQVIVACRSLGPRNSPVMPGSVGGQSEKHVHFGLAQ